VIEFRLREHSGIPTYLQLVHQVRQAVRLGLLRPGDQLPTVKEVVARLAINPNTVLKAYRELDREGLVDGLRGQGTFVAADLPPAALADQVALRAALARWVRRALDLGLDEDDVAALVSAAVDDAFAEETA
jgi:GntR family transcriptional regulator